MQRQFSRQKEVYIKKIFTRGCSRIAWFCFFYHLFIKTKHKEHKSIFAIPLTHIVFFTRLEYNNWKKTLSFLRDLKLVSFENKRTNKKGKRGIILNGGRKGIKIRIISKVFFKKVFFCLKNDLCLIDKKECPIVILQQLLRPKHILDYVDNMTEAEIKTYKKLYLSEKDMTPEEYEKYGIVELF
ncbi:MAG: hypothetical protein DRO96_01400 [Candidatus Aenigmatarchaeota archaeon]|nr:MAG: hypothetical protein DRO96_01400 [Candidatus Aenigmarchaeota archaeon]